MNTFHSDLNQVFELSTGFNNWMTVNCEAARGG